MSLSFSSYLGLCLFLASVLVGLGEALSFVVGLVL